MYIFGHKSMKLYYFEDINFHPRVKPMLVFLLLFLLLLFHHVLYINLKQMRSGHGDKNGQNGHIWPKYDRSGNMLIKYQNMEYEDG